MPKFIARYLYGMTMYQTALRYLCGMVGLSILLALINRIGFEWLDIVMTAAVVIVGCYTFNRILAAIFKVSTNKESWMISALILSLIVGPGDLQTVWLPLVVASAAAMASKFVLKWNGRHVFNPAAVGVIAMSLIVGTGSSWWVGVMPLTVFVLIGGLALSYKTRRLSSSLIFVVSYVVLFILLNTTQLDLATNRALLGGLLLNSPLIFFATVMLIEPATSPTGRQAKYVYPVVVAAAILLLQRFVPAVPYSMELGLLAGNLLTRLVEKGNNWPMTLVQKTALTPTVTSFFFETAPKINFVPGQFLEWTVPHPHADNRGVRRWFTIASSPTEKHIQLTTRFADKSSTLKKALQNLKIGDHIWAHGLEGDFVMPEDKTKALVMIAGGIGITPFRSMLKYLLDRGESRDITVFYGVRTEEDLVFDELLEEAKEAFGAKLVPIVSQPGQEWQGKVGQIDAKLLKEECPEIANCQVYVSGPEPMVEMLSQTLREIGVPNAAIRQDFFPGYTTSDVTGKN